MLSVQGICTSTCSKLNCETELLHRLSDSFPCFNGHGKKSQYEVSTHNCICFYRYCEQLSHCLSSALFNLSFHVHISQSAIC